MSEPGNRNSIIERQNQRLCRLVQHLSGRDSFSGRKFRASGLSPHQFRGIADLPTIPFTCKAELIADQQHHPIYGSVLTECGDAYCRMHQTSGTTTGRPLRWADTPASWDWLLSCWQAGFTIMGLAASDRAYFPFSFGPFLGFWTAFEAAARTGLLCLPGGGLSSTARLRGLLEFQATVVFATPTYALHLAELAQAEGIDLTTSAVRAIVVAGEPGGSLPGTRERIAAYWGARVFDHYGMTEIGPVAFEPADDPGTLVVLEDKYIAEVLEPGGTAPVAAGTVGELVLTNLGRLGSPLLRYRTGDLVRPARDRTTNGFLRLEGGILGRTDDMIHVRGNNLYPTAIEAVVRRFPEVAEFRLIVDQREALMDLTIEIEPTLEQDGPRLAEAVARAIRDEMLFRVVVRSVPPGSLPRFELKARRVVRVQDTRPE
ncbi:MAG: AMP-binding protein [Bacteroidales bacterium]|nr:AMP-binding protein [Bacteroidales bacterium]